MEGRVDAIEATISEPPFTTEEVKDCLGEHVAAYEKAAAAYKELSDPTGRDSKKQSLAKSVQWTAIDRPANREEEQSHAAGYRAQSHGRSA